MRLPCLLIVLVVARSAFADGGVQVEGGDARYVTVPSGRDIIIEDPGERTTKNLVVLASVAGAGLVAGAVGLYFNLDSQSAANSISASKFTGIPWTSADQAKYDHAHTSGVEAGVCYGIGGALVIGAIIGLIATEPKSETTVIHPHASPTVTPAPGGAVLGGTWSF